MDLLEPNINTPNNIHAQFYNCLELAKGEREVTNFLKNHLYLFKIFDHAWNAKYAESEVMLGDKHKIDFLTLSADSGQWRVSLIEAQSPKDSIYTKNGTHTKGLREAHKQLKEWKIWINHYKQQFRDKLADIVYDDCPARCSNASVHTFAKSELRDLRTVVHINYIALIGRRSDRNVEKNQHASQEIFEIVTYDRLLDYAQRLSF